MSNAVFSFDGDGTLWSVGSIYEAVRPDLVALVAQSQPPSHLLGPGICK